VNITEIGLTSAIDELGEVARMVLESMAIATG
jgi:hypothetical protein